MTFFFFSLDTTFHWNDYFVPGPMSGAGPIFNILPGLFWSLQWFLSLEPPFLSFPITALTVLLLKSQNLPASLIKARHLMQGENLRLFVDITEPFVFSTIIIIYSLFINF